MVVIKLPGLLSYILQEKINNLTAESFFVQRSSIDQYIQSMVIGLTFGAQMLFRLVFVTQCKKFETFQRTLNSFFCELVLKDDTTSKILYLELIADAKAKLKNKTIRLGFLAALNMAAITEPVLYIIAATHFPYCVLLPAIFINSTVMSAFFALLSLWINSYMQWFSIGFQIIRKKSESKRLNREGIRRLLYHKESLDDLVQEFNSLFQIPMIAWLFCVCIFATQQQIVIFQWIQLGSWVKVVVFLPTTILYPICIGSVCNAGSGFTNEILMMYCKLQCHPTSISPGDFLTLNRRTLASVMNDISK
ncbi:unnamed protein product [Orchesella dallaii]|uniref:Gustatory receptor n=1 Tax=Orchesella dallaii TaxID=48710 RepID=A0ABP1QJG5_9HEXA